ncbi:MAG TPA: NADH-quinone oxidoreductase subunit NuoF [Woeseiaceae bacterium]
MSAAAPVRVFVPRETAAVSLGADEVAAAVAVQAGGQPLTLVRNGSRGASWLEPLVEVEVDGQRLAYGPVAPEDVHGLFAAGFLEGGAHRLALGPTEEIPYLARQQRWTFARSGRIDPLSIDDYRAHGGLEGLERAFALGPAGVLEQLRISGLRGRGGAGFPTAIKWQTVADAASDVKYVACNADEGDSGTFSDRLLMEGDPFALIEGMAIAGFTTGAQKGYVYLRSEYPLARQVFGKALDIAREHGWLGRDIAGTGFDFDIELHIGAGSYVCGEETSMLESLEGRAGLVRYRPPLPAIAGLFGRPTVVNNVITLASTPEILVRGGAAYAALGTGRSRGTLPFQLAGNIRRGGLVELPFGLTLRELIEDFGGGTYSGRPIRAVQVGGPLGAYFPEHLLDTPLDYEAFAAQAGLIGHGGVVVFDDTVDMAAQARFAMAFCAVESCGKCTPCRIGSVRGVEVIDRIIAGEKRAANLALLEELCDTMVDGSLCAMGGMTPFPVRSVLRHFRTDFERDSAVQKPGTAARPSPATAGARIAREPDARSAPEPAGAREGRQGSVEGAGP